MFNILLVFQPKSIALSTEEKQKAQALGVPSGVSLVEVGASKPNYDVGAAMPLKLSFAKKSR